MFTLKVIDDSESGAFIPDKEHLYGGIDMVQIYAFEHLFPGGACPWTHRTLLFELAEIHGWEVKITKK